MYTLLSFFLLQHLNTDTLAPYDGIELHQKGFYCNACSSDTAWHCQSWHKHLGMVHDPLAYGPARQCAELLITGKHTFTKKKIGGKGGLRGLIQLLSFCCILRRQCVLPSVLSRHCTAHESL